MKTVAKIFIIIGMVCGFFAFFIPTIVGAIALNKLNTAKSKNDLLGVSICTILFCSQIGGILMLCLSDEDLNDNTYHQTSQTKENTEFSKDAGSLAEKLEKLKDLKDSGIISESEYQQKREELLSEF